MRANIDVCSVIGVKWLFADVIVARLFISILNSIVVDTLSRSVALLLMLFDEEGVDNIVL